MRIVMFYHTLLSDWNHGNAHFLRGIVSELLARGHEVAVFEPRDSWSLRNLLTRHGDGPVRKFREAYPGLDAIRYEPDQLDVDAALDGADLVIVHEWNSQSLVLRIGKHRERAGGYRLFFHDTHHRLVTEPQSMAAYDLSGYDGVLAFGDVLREMYETSGRVRQAWTWHEAADIRVFRPLDGAPERGSAGDLVWIGNWGDDERGAEITEFLLNPSQALGLTTRVYGVRYPEEAQRALAAANVEYAGWLPNFEAPRVFARFKATVHIPRRPYVQALPGIPTIRVFEALACGIPLVCSPWDDAENLFEPGRDFLVARNGREMARHLKTLLHEPEAASELAAHGLDTIRARHTCAHRVDELLAIYTELQTTQKQTATV